MPAPLTDVRPASLSEQVHAFVENDFAGLDASLQTFLVLDALIVGATPEDQDETLFRALQEGGRLPKGLRDAGQVADLRRRLVQQGVPYGDGFDDFGMAPFLRFALSSLAGDEEGACTVLERLGNLNEGYASSPTLLALAQTGAMYANRERDFELLFAQGPDAPQRMVQLRLARPPAEWGAGRMPAIRAAAAGDAVRSFFAAGELSPLLDLAARSLCGIADEGGKGIEGPSGSPGAAAGMQPFERACLWLWQGRRDAMAEALAEDPQARSEWRTWLVAGLDAFLRCEDAGEAFARSARLWAKAQRTKRRLVYGAPGLWQAAASFAGEGLAFGTLRAEIEEAALLRPGGVFACWAGTPGCKALLALDCLRRGALDKGRALLAEDAPANAAFEDRNCVSQLLRLAALKRLGCEGAEALGPALASWCRRGAALPLLEALFARLMEEGERQRLVPGSAGRLGAEQAKLRRFDQLVAGQDGWQMRLEALEAIALEEGLQEEAPQQGRRLLWAVDSGLSRVDPLDQTRSARGWSRPRELSLKRLQEREEELDWLSPVDRRLLSLAVPAGSGAELALDSCCELLDGLETVFLREADGSLLPASFKRGRMVLRLEDAEGGGLRLAVEGVDPTARDRGLGEVIYAREEEAGGRILVRYCRLSVRERQMAGIVGAGMDVPREAAARVLALGGEGSPIGLKAELAFAEAEADPTPWLALEPSGAGFCARVGVRPMGGEDTPFYPTAQGPAEVLAALQRDTLQAGSADSGPCVLRAQRSFQAEQEALEALASACPALGGGLEDHAWRCAGPEGLLELLAQLERSGQKARLCWPRGGEIRLEGVLAPEDLSLRIARLDRTAERFRLEGEACAPGGARERHGLGERSQPALIPLAELLASVGEDRFVRLGEGRFLALDDDLRCRLAGLAAVTDEGGPASFGVLAAAAVAVMAEGMRLECDKAFEAAVEARRRAFAAEPEIPSGFMAELADYQREGCLFIQRRALWGAGACLCDEPGLGKGVQAAACLLAEARRGPCLVVCPDLALAGCERALARFAPDLETRRIGDAASPVKAGPGDVLLLGWSRLEAASPCLAKAGLAMAVFDGAGRLAREAVRRAALGAGARIALVLGDMSLESRPDLVWPVLSLAAPGLLGSREGVKRLAQTQPGSYAGRALRRLARAFVLRRSLADAAEDLPARRGGAKILLVDPLPAERERVRQLEAQALELLQAAPGPARRRRLVQALRDMLDACQPAPAGSCAETPPSAKIQRLAELARDFAEAGLAVACVCGQGLDEAAAELARAGLACLALDGPLPGTETAREGEEDQGQPPVLLASSLASLQASSLADGPARDLAAAQTRAGSLALILLQATAFQAAEAAAPAGLAWPAPMPGADSQPDQPGQASPALVLRLVLAGTLEERLAALPAERLSLVEALLAGQDPGAKRLPSRELFELAGAD